MADVVHVDAAAFERAGASVAESLDRAAQPGRVPMAVAGTSPADAAASAVVAAMGSKVAEASAELAPRGPEIREASRAAADGLRATDGRNAALLQGVPATLGHSASATNGSSAGTGGAQAGIQMVSDGWDDPREPWRIGPDFEEDEHGSFVPPIHIDGGGGAAAGNVGGGRAPV